FSAYICPAEIRVTETPSRPAPTSRPRGIGPDRWRPQIYPGNGPADSAATGIRRRYRRRIAVEALGVVQHGSPPLGVLGVVMPKLGGPATAVHLLPRFTGLPIERLRARTWRCSQPRPT